MNTDQCTKDRAQEGGGAADGVCSNGHVCTCEDGALRRAVREAIRVGRMPTSPPHKVWGGPNVNLRCGICEEPFQPQETSLELEYLAEMAFGRDNLEVHMRCFRAWELERVALSSNSADARSSPAKNDVRAAPAGSDAERPWRTA